MRTICSWINPGAGVPSGGGDTFLFGTAMDTLSSLAIFFGASGTLKIVILRILNSKRNHVLSEVIWKNYGQTVMEK